MHTDPAKVSDQLDVARAAGLLDISEFRVFQIAYRRWYGHPADSGQTERAFRAYLWRNNTPFWVHHFTREVLGRAKEGTLRPADYGVGEQPLGPGERRRGLLLSALVLVLVVLLLTTAVFTEDLPPPVRNCYFPPCY